MLLLKNTVVGTLIGLSFFYFFSSAIAETPQENYVDILWQSSGYVPPFYHGKAIYGHQNTVTFVAVPHIVQNGQVVSSKNLNYKWKKNSTVYGEVSGHGLQTFTPNSTNSISETYSVTVDISMGDDLPLATKTIDVDAVSAQVVLYEDNPLYGIQFQKALSGNIDLKNNEIVVAVFPYFFDIKNQFDRKISYKWNMNGSAIENTNAPTLTLRKEGASGISSINVSVQNIKEFMQNGVSDFTLHI